MSVTVPVRGHGAKTSELTTLDHQVSHVRQAFVGTVLGLMRSQLR